MNKKSRLDLPTPPPDISKRHDWNYCSSYTVQNYVYDFLIAVFKLILSIFFREMRERGVWHVPKTGPVLFVIAPHSNQFVDPLMVLKFSGRRVAFCTAAKSMRRKFVGAFAKALQSIPVERAQDLMFHGSGTVSALAREGSDIILVKGTDTNFAKQLTAKSVVNIAKLKIEITQILSESQAEGKLQSGFLGDLPSDSVEYTVTPHVGHELMFNQVTNRLECGGCVGIFPEGGSHDRSTFLPMKAGAAIMALTALAKNPNLGLSIVPVGLNYFKPYKFRSRAVVEFGAPIEISSDLISKFRQGGTAKRQAVSALMELILLHLKALTVTASDYDTLMIIQAARRLYQVRRNLSAVEKLDLTRKVALGIEKHRADERIIALSKQVSEYNRLLRVYGLHDHQVQNTDMSTWLTLRILAVRLATVLAVTPFMLPGFITHFPIVAAARFIASKKAKEALAASSVKIKGFDVLASWKIMITAVVAPVLYVTYAVAVFTFAFVRLQHSLWDSFCNVFIVMSGLATMGIVALALGDVYVPLLYSLKPLYLSLPLVNSVELDPERLRRMRKGLSTAVTNLINELKPTMSSDYELWNSEAVPRARRLSASDVSTGSSRLRYRKRSDSDSNRRLQSTGSECSDFSRMPFSQDGPPKLTSAASACDDSDDCSGFPLNWSRRDETDEHWPLITPSNMRSSTSSITEMSASVCSTGSESNVKSTPTSPSYGTRNSTPHILGTF